MSLAGTGQRLDPADFDLFDPRFYADGDPHPLWSQMRASHPLHRQELSDGRAFWSVTRYEDAAKVLGDHHAFTSARGSLLHQLGRPDPAAGQMLVSTDPPRHTQLRRALSPVLSPKALRLREPGIRQAVRRLLAPHDDAWDLAKVAARLPMAVAGELMTLPERDWPQLSLWTDMAASPQEPEYCLRTPAATLAIAHHSLFEYFSEQVRQRSRAPGEGLIGHLMSMRAGGGPLSASEVIYNCYSLLLGANATTPHTITGTILALTERPAEYERARGSVQGLVDEGLRWTSPASSFLRHALADVSLSGGTVRKGDAVAIWVGSANRDEDVFRSPYEFDVARRDNRHLAFGHGPHYCVGAWLARMTLRVFFEEWFTTFGRVELAGPVRHLASTFIAGITHLPVRAHPPSAS